ncbi:fasciclin domain-containing protein [Falsirhodobacter xinxiangensis]|uniref:fasciclin domain-containing protein n=1 Tax=Falsirhodobacter xinxiangensis TaxID=2530049 RepID=UPI0010AA03C6|nr:fasciclin domain-containing protein [Rhodobacter xinxiangensis]
MRPFRLAAAMILFAFPAVAENVYDFAAHSAQHRTFAATMHATGIDRALGNRGPYTIFAPTDAAFSRLSGLGQLDREELVELLTCHMAPTQALAATLQPGQSRIVRTVGGCTLTMQRVGDEVLLRSSGGQSQRIAAADLRQSNGVVHVIDMLILPES